VPPLGGGKGTGFVGSRKATENPVTRFPAGKVVAPAAKKRGLPQAANHKNDIFADEYKGTSNKTS